jgi:perosamine synthetase
MNQSKIMKIPFFKPEITPSDKKYVLKAMSQRWLTNGPMLKKFESKINTFIGTKFSIGVGNATQALHLSLKSLNIGPGDEVIVPTFTFAATANAVIYCGAKPIFADVDLDTFNINTKSITKKISKKTKAIIPVHYGGQSCDMDEIQKISKLNNLFIIEDCAHALGSKFKNHFCGSIGNVGCFSFYPTKIITSGEGGMVTTNNSSINKRINLLKSHALSTLPAQREAKAQWKYDVLDLGYNYRLDEIRSALGISQFSRIKKMNNSRKKIAKIYDKSLKNIMGITSPLIKESRNHIYHLYTIIVEDNYHMSRDELFLHLHSKGIGTSVQYYPLHLMSYYKSKYSFNNSDFSNANYLKDRVLSIPIYPTMTLKEIEYVVNNLK